jgi:hypothetical protein
MVCRPQWNTPCPSRRRRRFLSALAVMLTSLVPPRAPVADRLTSLCFLCRSPSVAPPPPSTFLVAAPLLRAGEPHSDRSRADHRGDATLDLPPPDTGAAQPEPPPAPLAALPHRRACVRAAYGRARAAGCHSHGPQGCGPRPCRAREPLPEQL